MGWARESSKCQGTGGPRAEGAERCRVQGWRSWPGPVGKELQCVTPRLAGEDPLCDAIMRAVRDGLVWVGGCDETEESKMESSHMQLPRHEGVQRAHEHSGLSTADGEVEAEAEARRRVELCADDSQHLALVCWNWRRFTGPSGATIPLV